MRAGRPQERRYWLDESRNVTRVYHGLVVICALLLASELLISKHAELGFQEWFGIDAIASFIACMGIVFVAKGVRRFLKRGEDYYDR